MSQSMKEEQEFLNDFEAASDFNCRQDIIKMEVEMMQADNPHYETTHHENIEGNKIEQRGIITFFKRNYFLPIYSCCQSIFHRFIFCECEICKQ